MATKDPAFLFYSKDWLSGTAEMMPEEKGVFIDLMVHQHQNGSVPIELERIARIVGLSMDDFQRIWKVVGKKYFEEDGRLYNKKMCDVMGERKDKGWRNKITGTFAAVLRKSQLSQKEYSAVRKAFKIEDWLETDSERLTECLTEWLHLCLKSIGNGDEDEDNTGVINKKTIIEIISQKQDDLKKSIVDFIEVNPLKYPKTLYRAFFNYWSEPYKNPKPKKAIRQDKEETWDLSGRLATWYKRGEVAYDTDLENEKRSVNPQQPNVSKQEATTILKTLTNGTAS